MRSCRYGRTPAHKQLELRALPEIEVKNASKCDFIANSPKPTGACMLPFPDDYYTTPDSSSETGLKVNFQNEAMPSNAFEQHIEAAPYNEADGFSPGSVILLKVPGIETMSCASSISSAPSAAGSCPRT